MNRIKILVVDDHGILRDSIRALLELHDDIKIVGEASNGKEAIEKARELVPDVVLMDIVMPGMDGLEATRHIKKSPRVKILALTQYDSKEYVLAAIKAGVDGYLPKNTVAAELVTAIRSLHRGDTFLQPSATKALIEGYMQQVKVDHHDHLTVKEREILKLVAEGHTSRKISDTLHISLKMVQGHRVKITKRLSLRNRTELVKYAVRKGLLSIDT